MATSAMKSERLGVSQDRDSNRQQYPGPGRDRNGEAEMTSTATTRRNEMTTKTFRSEAEAESFADAIFPNCAACYEGKRIANVTVTKVGQDWIVEIRTVTVNASSNLDQPATAPDLTETLSPPTETTANETLSSLD